MRRLLTALAIVALAVLPARAFDLFNVKNSLIQFALEQISTDDFTITAENVESPGDGVTDLVGVQIADKSGVWFEAERMGLQWNARRILSGELEINRLAAEGVRVLRRPEGSVEVKEDAAIAEDAGEPFSWPRAPIATRVDELRLDRVFIAEGVINAQSLAFDATGAARDEGDEQSVRLEITRTDAVQGRIALDYLRDFATNQLRANLDAEEAAGGLVAALAGFPEDSASRVTLKADGPLTAWRMELAAETERVFDASGTARVDLEAPIAVVAEFRVAPGDAMDPAVAGLLGEAAEIAVDVAEDAAGVIAIREGAVRSPALTLDAEGSYDKATGRADLDIKLDAKGTLADLAEGVAFDGFGFDGQVAGTPEDLTASGALRLDGLTTEPADIGAARLSTEVRKAGNAIDFAVDGTAEGLRIDKLGPDLLGPADLAIRGRFAEDVLDLAGLSLQSRALTAEAEGRLDLGTETAALRYALTTPDLAPIAAAYGADAGGRGGVSGAAEGPLAAVRLTGEAALEALAYQGTSYGAVRLSHDVTAGEEVAGALALRAEGSPAGPVTADLDFALAGQRLTMPRLVAEGLGARIDGRLAVDLETTLAEGFVRLDAPDLSPASELAGAPVRGAAEGKIGLLAARGVQEASLDLEISGLDGFGAKAEAATVLARIVDLEQLAELGAQITARGVSYADLGLASLSADLIAKDALSSAPEARLELGAEALSAAGARVRRAEITASVVPEAGATGATGAKAQALLSGIAAGGASFPSARIDLKGSDVTGPAPRIVAAVRAPKVSAPGAEIADLGLDAAVTDPAGTPRIDAKLTTGRVAAEGAEFDSLVATVKGALSQLAAALETQGEALGKPVSLTAAAQIDAAAAEPRVRLSAAEAKLGDDAIRLAAPLTIRAGTSTRIEGLNLSLPGGALTGEAALHGGGLAADLLLRMTDLAPLARLAELPIRAGTATLALGLDTRPGRARGTLDLDSEDLRFEKALADLGAVALTADGVWDGRRANLNAAVTGPFGQPLRVTGAVPLRPTGGPVPQVPAGAPLSGRLAWVGDIGELWALVPAPGHVLDGELDLDLGIAGTLDAPRIDGAVSLADGRYENLDLGTILTGIALRSELSGEGGIRLTLTAEDGAKGRLEAKADVTPDRVAAQLSSQGAVLIRRDDATAAISLDIRAEGPLSGPDIAGTVTVDRAEIRLVNATPPSVVTLGEVRIKGAPEPKEEAPAGGAIALDVKVRGSQDIFVRGRGLDSEWQIGIDVAGTAAAPRITGAVERIRGRLSLIGTIFDLVRGEVRFLGGAEIDPRLDVRLEADENGVTGGIQVSGTASAPEIGFYSRQGLPEDEVLPRILFGKPSQSLTGSQAIRLASGLATLLDGSGGVVDDVRGAVGLDTLAIEPTDDSADITLGKNITDNVFVGAKQSLDGSETRLSVEVEVFEDILVDSEVNQEGDASLGVQWKTDF